MLRRRQTKPFTSPLMRQLILDLLPNPPFSFENFVIGDNAAALSALAAWLATTNPETPFFLWGESGVGKSHLLRASRATYCDAGADPNLGSLATADHCHAIDNVEQLSASGQIALFHLINRLRDRGGRVLAAARLAPFHLGLREDLRTRLGSGLVYRLQALSEENALVALREHALARGMVLPKEIINYLFHHAPRDMRSLCALLTALDRYSLEQRRPLTLPLLRELLHTPSEL